MPMLLGTKGADILQWRASADLVAELQEKLTRKWEQCPSGEAQSFLEQFIAALREERGYEAQLAGALDTLNQGITDAGAPAELLPLKARYLEVVSSHFRRRRSVLALCGLSCELHDRLLGKAVFLAGERMMQLGQGKAPAFALLVSGDRGRSEQTLKGVNRYFLLHEEEPSRFLLFRRQFAVALQEVGLPGGDLTLWRGNLAEWRSFLDGSLAQPESGPADLAPLAPFASPQAAEPQALPPGEWSTVELADLIFLRGKAPLAAEALAAAAQALQVERDRAEFLELSRQVIGLPLALGRFGRWRLERGGAHKGELNLTKYALAPLVMTLRVLALHSGIQAAGSVDRIKGLLEKGALDVDLAGRLLQAYQCLMQLRILIEIRGEEGDSFCNPEEFSTETEHRFRNALDAVLSLQKIGYQRLVGQG